ncbi:Regulator of nonsense transcripts 1 [Thelohanellus kitauei]|uniref:Regulator of nonsense transcripts 1 n=1 Tax=Thelohanellus kitauei TaxID=669202 RepID=A0A0C2MQ07_THEKT|nr:Regulator of nonsense transcripts 1 [Thelohanellus kitauei]
MSTHLSFERRMNTRMNLDLLKVFIEEFKIACVNCGYYDFNHSQVEELENTSEVEELCYSSSESNSSDEESSIEWTLQDYFEELWKYLKQQDAVDTQIHFENTRDYGSFFSKLIKDESECQQMTLEAQEKYNDPFNCTIINYEKRRVMLTPQSKAFRMHLKFGDFVRIRERGSANKLSMGSVVEIKDTNRQILVDLPLGYDIPSDRSSCYLDLIWRCVTSARMMASLHNFVKIDSNVNTYLKNKLLGIPAGHKNFKINIQENFHVPGLPELNESQLEIVRESLKKRLSLIQGPPGTGKTVIIAALVYYIVTRLGKKVLVCASSNKAVDNVYEKIRATGVKVVRVMSKYRQLQEDLLKKGTSHPKPHTKHRTAGNEPANIEFERVKTADKTIYVFDITNLSSHAVGQLAIAAHAMSREESLDGSSLDLKRTLKKNKCKGYFDDDPASYKTYIRNDESISGADVVCATCSGAGSAHVFGLKFDFVILDESTQATEPESLIPISLCKGRLIMVGDHRQLGPVVISQSASKAGLSLSLFERFIQIGIVPYRLNKQYRMHPALSEFSSLAFYEGSVKNGVTSEERTYEYLPLKWPVVDKPTLFYATCGTERFSSSGTSFYNRKEVKAVKMFVTNLIDSGVKGSQIGIITPYDGQRLEIVDFITKRCREEGSAYSEIEVANVHPFQGREKDYIVISCVRSNCSNNIGFLKDPRLLNVAITRAR